MLIFLSFSVSGLKSVLILNLQYDSVQVILLIAGFALEQADFINRRNFEEFLIVSNTIEIPID